MVKYLTFLLSSILLYVYAPSSMDKEYMFIEVVLSLFFTINFFIKTRKNSRMGAFSHSHIFIVIFLIVFYQYYIDYILGFIDTSEKRTWINTSIVAKSLGVVQYRNFFISFRI